ncbi:HNH nuclease [Vibrio phage 1.170.O._10N.261.52.C3]|nr:HNH nuclease [Vibrio phage 1.170.O._10N.261.52.C3]
MEKRRYKNTPYFVDEEGNVYGKRVQYLKQQLTKKGYKRVSVTIDKTKYTLFIHRMVATVFIPNPENKPEVNHIDGDKTNNHVSNLEWMTTKENINHANTVLGKGVGETHSQATLTEIQVREVCEYIEQGYRTVDVQRITGIGLEKIKSIKKKAVWKNVVCDYNFPKGKSDHGISDETFLWICHLLERACTAPEIISKYTGGAKLTPQMISAIRTRKMRPELSKNFNF